MMKTKGLHVKKDDNVVVISGQYKGKTGKVLRAMPKDKKVVVEGINMVTRHTKPRGANQSGGRIEQEGAIYASKVMLLCPKCNKATRVAHQFDANGAKQRVCKKCGQVFDR